MKKDIQIQKDVIEELIHTPMVNANEIGVAVVHGIATLTGTVDSYPKKIRIEKAVKKIRGIRGIAEEIVVKLNGNQKKTDTEIAEAVLHAIEWHSAVQVEQVKITVEDGWLTLEGTVDWDFQRKSAATAAESIKGVTGITNNIKLSATPATADVKEKIQSAFVRNASLDAGKIQIEVMGSKVILNGEVYSWTEYEEAERSAWNTPGVSSVENKLKIYGFLGNP